MYAIDSSDLTPRFPISPAHMHVFEAQPEYFSSIQMLKRSSAASAGHCGYMSLSIHIELAITFDPRVNITDQR